MRPIFTLLTSLDVQMSFGQSSNRANMETVMVLKVTSESILFLLLVKLRQYSTLYVHVCVCVHHFDDVGLAAPRQTGEGWPESRSKGG